MSSPLPTEPPRALTVPGDTESLLCPLCDYDLRAQVEPRCPECGYTFDWTELRDPARRRHRYLFEHHSERNLWSLRRTFIGGLRPRRFWAEMYPTQPSHVARLLVYWIILASASMLPFIAILGDHVEQVDASNRMTRIRWAATMTPRERTILIGRFGSVQSAMDHEVPVWPSWGVIQMAIWQWRLPKLLLPGLIALAWPWLTFGALMVFQISMRRAKVRPAHVLRCVIYSADAGLVVALLAGLAIYPLLLLTGSRSMFYFDLTSWGLYFSQALFVMLTYRLWIAYRKYLRFDHALATVVVSQIMVGLLVFKFALDWHFVGY